MTRPNSIPQKAFATVTKLTGTLRRRRQRIVASDFDESTTKCNEDDSSTLAIENVDLEEKDRQWLPQGFDCSRRNSFTFSLLRGLASTASRSHTSIRDGIILHSLRILKEEFPLREKDPDVEDVFENLLTLCNPEFLNRKARMEALALLLNQIQLGESRLLVEIIAERADNEIRMLVSQLLACLPTSWMEITRENIHFNLQVIFECSPGNNRLESIVPFLRFLLLLSQQSISAAQAVLECGYMDLILCLCLSDFSDFKVSRTVQIQEQRTQTAVFTLCLSTLSVLVAHPVNHRTLASRWSLLRKYWPAYFLQAFDESFCNHVLLQCHQPTVALDQLGKPFIRRRLLSVSSVLDDPKFFVTDDSCSELLSLSRCCKDSEIKQLIIMILAKLMASSSFLHQGCRELHAQITKIPYKHVVDLLYALIRFILGGSLGAFGQPIMQEALQVIDSLLEFAEYATETSPTLRTAFVEAGILSFEHFRSVEYWQRFRYTPSVPRGSREKMIRTLDDEKGNVLRLM